MKKRYRYSIKEMTVRLLKIASGIKWYLVISTLASIIGNLSHMGLMSFGALWILTAAGYAAGSPVFYASAMAVCGFLIAFCRYLEGVFSHLGAYGVLAAMRVDLFRAVDRVSPAFMIERQTGDILNIATGDIETLEFFFAHTIGPMFTVILLPLTAVLTAWHFSGSFALLLIPFYILISVIIPLIALRTGRKPGMRYRQDLGKLKALILESVYGLRDIQIFRAGREKLAAVLRQNDLVNRSSHRLVLHRQTVSSLPDFFVSLARIMILAAAGLMAVRGKQDPVGTIVVSYAAAASFSSTFSLTFVVSHLLETFAAAERIFIIEDTVPAVSEAAVTEDPGRIDTVTFDNVSFRYPGREKYVLEHVSMEIRKGDHIGIIGESGAGKSTLLRLLLRFYDVSEGAIRMNGTDIRNMSLEKLHAGIGLLEQETYLFNGTIAENIRLAKPGASKEEIRLAASKAGLAEFIETLPDGYETDMGEMNARLSGGERQRLGIARIFLKSPDIVILDEPASALDVLHEKELLQILNREYKEKTVIVISHRMSTLSGCSRIWQIEEGRITEISA